jgi:serine/threonine-protein kinase RsbW
MERFNYMHLGQLQADEATELVKQVARRHDVTIDELAQNWLVQQFGGSPFFINLFLQTAREKGKKLDSPLERERHYVDELFGGHLHSYFENLLEEISPRLNIRLLLIALLWNAVSGRDPASSFETWEKRLRMDPRELEEMLERLHMHEVVNWETTNIQVATGPQIWTDYLKIRYQLDVENKPRALVFGRALTDALKGAPDTRNRQLKQSQQVSPGELVSRFNCQRVPKILFDYGNFSRKYKGEQTGTIAASLETETESLTLPETVHTASCDDFSNDKRRVSEDKRCLIARAFEEATYSDATDVIWLVAFIDAKQAVDVTATGAREWCERFKDRAGEFQFNRYQIWLISNSGFTDEALGVLAEYEAFSSNRQQFELLTARIGETPRNPTMHNSEPNEFRLEMPFGEDNELVAAGTVEQIARRLPFRPDAINQIKMAVVEACINVFEHSFSPDQKISQRFRLESDRLVVTISSRGLVPTNLNGASSRSDTTEAAEARRGYGLILIRSLMDEVEFEPVDDGTSLRMTKYLRDASS